MIEVQGLRKSFGPVRAVDDVSFTVPDGAVTGFLGPNVTGNSSTMRLMLGLDHGAGATLYDGKRITEVESVTRTVGAHLDAKYFHPKRTARQHLRMLATEARLPDSRVDEVLEVFGLTSVAGKRPKGFSLGMGQRLGLAGAVLADPAALLLDEPANGLDPQSIHWLRDFLKAYADRGRTVFVSSHLLSEMELMADHIVVIGRGRILAEGPMAQFTQGGQVRVRTRPQHEAALLVALPAAVRQQDGSWLVSDADAEQVGLALFAAGVPVTLLATEQASLESVFLQLTTGEEQFKTGAA